MASQGARGNVGAPPISGTIFPDWGTGRPKALAGSGGFHPSMRPPGTPRTLEAGTVSGSERGAKPPEMGREAVFAKHSTDEGGEPRPTGPPGGKAMPGLTFSGRERRERP